MRSEKISRLYLQCKPDEDINLWPDDKIWQELNTRLASDGRKLTKGPVLQKGVTGMRSFVVEPMQYGRMFLAGDSAHIVPPTGAKGLNLAVADVRVLARALADFYTTGRRDLLDAYSENLPAACLEGATFFLVDDFHAAPISRRQSLRQSPPARRTGLCNQLARSIPESGGKLCGSADGMVREATVLDSDVPVQQLCHPTGADAKRAE